MRYIQPNAAYIDYTALISSMTGKPLLNPTLAVGDAQISVDGGNFNNITTLPTVTPAAQGQVQYVLAALEIGTNTEVCLRFLDQTNPPEWDTQLIWHRTDGITVVQIRQEMDANSAQLAAILEDTAHIGTGEVVVTSPMSADGESIELVRGDDYATEDNRQLEWTEAAGSNWPDLTGATVKFTARSKFNGTVGITKTATVVTPTGTKKVRCPLTDTETDDLGLGTAAYNYDLEATLATSGRIVTLVRGTVTVLEDYTRPA